LITHGWPEKYTIVYRLLDRRGNKNCSFDESEPILPIQVKVEVGSLSDRKLIVASLEAL
jgi:hypothetical protein